MAYFQNNSNESDEQVFKNYIHDPRIKGNGGKCRLMESVQLPTAITKYGKKLINL